MRIALVVCSALLAFAALAAVALGSRPGERGASAGDLAVAKTATARFRSVAEALKAGYVAPPNVPASCVSSPLGGMGYHYENPRLMAADVLEVRKPEILVYEKTANGALRLVALEYFKNDADRNVRTQGDRPRLFGRAFDGPMPGHHPGMGVHYDLHVWLWKPNSRGLFDPWNPKVRCSS